MFKMNAFNRKFIMVFLLVVMLSPVLPSGANECSYRWFPIPQLPYNGGAYPEWSATYWTYLFENLPEDSMLEFKGKYPYARYMSFTVYNWSTGNPYGSLLDKHIAPDLGSQNPFVPGNPRNTARSVRNYTIKVVHEGSVNKDGPNVIIIPANVEKIAIIMRIYLPDEDWGDRGGVRLPVVTAKDDDSGADTFCPGTVSFEDLLMTIVPPDTFPDEKLLKDRVVFYRPHIVEGNGLFANGNNPYMIAPFKAKRDDQVALVRFRPPNVPNTNSGGLESFTGEEDARYWSVCMVDIADSSTSRCINDVKAVLDEDGFFNLAIGSLAFFNEKPVDGWNYLPWGVHDRPALMIRQLEPRGDFAGNFFQVEETFIVEDPAIPESAINVETMTVDEFTKYSEDLIKQNDISLGDYAPKGIYCSEQAFVDGLCVIQ